MLHHQEDPFFDKLVKSVIYFSLTYLNLETGVKFLPETQVMKPILGLQEGERVVWSGRPTRKGYLSLYIRAIVGGILFWILFGASFFLGFYGSLFGFVMFLIFAGPRNSGDRNTG